MIVEVDSLKGREWRPVVCVCVCVCVCVFVLSHCISPGRGRSKTKPKASRGVTSEEDGVHSVGGTGVHIHLIHV